MPESNKRSSLTDLVAVMEALRTPVTGCPWDLEQTFETIAPYTIEEAYEVADAIGRRDMADLMEELGDLLLQVVYHSRLAEEQNAFALADVIDGIAKKMVRRHPHVFGDDAQRSAGAAEGFWETIKSAEKAGKAAERARLNGSAGTASVPTSILDDVPVTMPGLTRAIKLQEKAAKVGFDWPSVGPVLDKIREEIAELEAEIAAAPAGTTQGQNAGIAGRIEDEYGDLLFVLANLGRHLKVDPEAALRKANQKFTRRFHSIETRLAERSKTPAQSDLAEMDALWDEAKRAERS